MPVTQTRELPTGKTTETTTEQGSIYADPAHERVVRLDDSENFPDKGYRVEVWTLDEDGEVTRDMEFWGHAGVSAFAERDDTEYLAGHGFAGHGPHGVWTKIRENCPECGTFMRQGFYHVSPSPGRAGGWAPGMVCPNSYRDETTVTNECSGYMDYETLHAKGGYVTAEEYVQRRFGGEN